MVTASSSPRDLRILCTLRKAILSILTVALIGMSTELWLIGHHEDSNQIIPLIVVGATLVVIAWVAMRPSLVALRTMQFVMLTLAGTGVIGITLHVKAGAESQRDLNPSITTSDLVWTVVDAAAPPALAPALLVLLGALGLVYTYKHPALGDDTFPHALA